MNSQFDIGSLRIAVPETGTAFRPGSTQTWRAVTGLGAARVDLALRLVTEGTGVASLPQR